mmetsp:Transcript_29344/g.91440  ORF Transcript_29344/g.91440 Transcript_29344/m.91440 type:complete len:505 (+) Transcript_29344:210-1724(+)
MVFLLRGLVAARGAAQPLEVWRNCLTRLLQHPNEVARVGLLVLRALGFGAEEADGEATLASATSSPYSVDVVLNRQREGVIYNQLDILDIQASARHVRGNERSRFGLFEVSNCLCSLLLRHVALQGNDLLVSLAPQEVLQPGRLLLVEAKHDDLFVRGIVLLQMMEQTGGFLLLVLQHLNLLADGLVRRQAAAILEVPNGHHCWRGQELSGQVVDGCRPGGAKHARLPNSSLGHLVNEALDGIDETHVQHAVRLVKDEVLHVAEVHGAVVGQILQPPGAGDEHVHALFLQRSPLLPLRHAAVNAQHRVAIAQGLRKLGANLRNLHGKLPRGRHADEAGRVDGLLEVLQDAFPGHGQVRQGEAHGLAAARLGDAADVTSLHDDGPAARLDGRRALELALAILHELLGEAVVAKAGEWRNVHILAIGHAHVDLVGLEVGLGLLSAELARLLRQGLRRAGLGLLPRRFQGVAGRWPLATPHDVASAAYTGSGCGVDPAGCTGKGEGP